MLSPLDRAKAKLGELEKEAARIRQFIAMYQEFSDPEAKIASRPTHTTEPPDILSENDMPSVTIKDGIGHRLRPSAIAMMAAKVIRNEQRPMTRGELVDALQEHGVTLPSADTARYLGTILWRSNELFENIEGRGYWLKNEPLPPEGGLNS